MRKNFQKTMMALAVASLGFATPASAADAVVTTNKVWLSGATHIFGRMTTSGLTTSSIKEQGFCYSSENTKPTVEDKTCKVYLTNNGNIYNMSGLEPATVYYIRAYVKKTNGEVIYGEPVKAITRPGGNVTYTINSGFPDDANTRIQAAAKQAAELWNEYTGINGFHVTINYGAQTPTADCSYGGWMRVGPNASYQKTGTLLHEMLHGVGVGTTGIWQNSYMRANTTSGYWLGVRATRALRFWDNSTTSRLNGDGTHMWPYGVNGAHEDNGTQLLYIGNSVLCEALGEDGLPPTSGQFAIPAYVFEQNDTVKYYLKNEEYGISSKFLRVDKTGNLQWTAMDPEEATANDSAAWYVSFDPATCYYSLKNAATGGYMSYKSNATNGFVTKQLTEVTANEKFHFLPSSIEVEKVKGEMRTGYWIGNVSNNSDRVLEAQNAKDPIKGATLKFAKDAGAQRWLILDKEEVLDLCNNLKESAANKYNQLLENVEALLAVPHQELEAGKDAEFTTALAELKEKAAKASSADDFEAIETEAVTAAKTFLSGVAALSADQLFDISFLIQNAGLDAVDGWSAEPTINYSCGEFYQKSFDMAQKLARVPAGLYEMKVQAFQRPGTSATVNTDYAAGTDKAEAYIYLISATNKQKIKNIMVDAQTKKVGVGTEVAVGTKYVPNNMQAAAAYFAKGLYDNSVKATMKVQGTLTIGIKGSNSGNSYWTIMDNFRLYYYGKEDVTGIAGVTVEKTQAKGKSGIYTIGGQLVSKDAAELDALPHGIYIVNGKKVVK